MSLLDYFRNSSDRGKGENQTTNVASVESMVAAADRLRDSGRPAEAAMAYAVVLGRDPGRADIRGQFANMLKDSGAYAEAEAEYRKILLSSPDSADALLQLGRTLRMTGRAFEAEEAFRRSFELDPRLDGAAAELLRQRELRFASSEPNSLQGMAAIQRVVAELAELRRRVDEALRLLPDLARSAATPVENYGLLRASVNLPPPPADRAAPRSILVETDIDLAPEGALHGLIRSLRDQTHRMWRFAARGVDPARRAVVERAMQVDVRFGFWSEEHSGAERLILRPGVMLRDEALAWIAAAAQRQPEHALFFDEEIGRIDERGAMIADRIVVRSAADLDSFLEADTIGGTIFLPSSMQTDPTAEPTATIVDLIRKDRLAHLALPLIFCRATDVDKRLEVHSEARLPKLAAALKTFAPTAKPRVPGPHALGRIQWGPPQRRSIGIAIASRDNASDLETFVQSLIAKAARPDRLFFRLLDHLGEESETAEVFVRLGSLPGVSVARCDETFNWALFNNRAAETLKCELFVFANDDMIMLSEGWDDCLDDILSRPDVGVVGARLIFRDGTYQHAGVIAGWQGAVNNEGVGRPLSDPGPGCRWHLTRSASAVVGAFHAMRADVFRAIGGYDAENLPIAFSDVDLCFKARALDLKVVYTPHVTLTHYELKTRGADTIDEARRARYAAEEAVMKSRWPAALARDPSVHPMFLDIGLPCQMIAMPGAERILDYLDCTASLRPWRLEAIGRP